MYSSKITQKINFSKSFVITVYNFNFSILYMFIKLHAHSQIYTRKKLLSRYMLYYMLHLSVEMERYQL